MPTRDQMNRAAEPMRLALPGPVIPTDPRDAEIARLRALVTELLGNVDDLTVELNEHRLAQGLIAVAEKGVTAQLAELSRDLALARGETDDLAAQLNAAKGRIADMEGQLMPHQRPAEKKAAWPEVSQAIKQLNAEFDAWLKTHASRIGEPNCR